MALTSTLRIFAFCAKPKHSSVSFEFVFEVARLSHDFVQIGFINHHKVQGSMVSMENRLGIFFLKLSMEETVLFSKKN